MYTGKMLEWAKQLKRPCTHSYALKRVSAQVVISSIHTYLPSREIEIESLDS